MLDINSGAPGSVIALPTQAMPWMQGRIGEAVTGAIKKALSISRIETKYRELAAAGHLSAEDFCASALDSLGISYTATAMDLAKIPATGPVVTVSNHPYGMLDGLILIHMLKSARPDVKVLANGMLARIAELKDIIILVNPFGTKNAVRENYRGIRTAIEWVRSGGMLATFPAGEVSHASLIRRSVVDPAWSPATAAIVRRTGASVLPVFFFGSNDVVFQTLGFLHPKVRTAMLPGQLLKKSNSKIGVAVGKPIAYPRIGHIREDQDMADYLRRRTYVLAGRDMASGPKPRALSSLLSSLKPTRHAAAIKKSEGAHTLAEAVAALPVGRKLLSKSAFDVYCARAEEMGPLLAEIGRLRELTFRAVGEGTGAEADLDRFDTHYRHLFVWDREKQCIAGAYRMGATDEILPSLGIGGLYTSTLFKFKEDAIRSLGPSLELGRSFVAPEYQRQYLPLLLLWSGVGRFAGSHPRYRHLFGPVSISETYTQGSRRLMVSYLSTACADPLLAGQVRPRTPFKLGSPYGMDIRSERRMAGSFEELSELVTDIEADAKDVPILLKQYMRLGARVLAFNVDRAFGNALDGLVLVDLAETPKGVLAKYMGGDLAAAYIDYKLTRSGCLGATSL